MEFQVNVKTCTYLISMYDFFKPFSFFFFFDFVSKKCCRRFKRQLLGFFPIIKVCWLEKKIDDLVDMCFDMIQKFRWFWFCFNVLASSFCDVRCIYRKEIKEVSYTVKLAMLRTAIKTTAYWLVNKNIWSVFLLSNGSI